MTILLKNAIVVNEGRQFRGYVAIDGEVISAVGEGEAPQSLEASCQQVRDLQGMMLLPGVIDDQVHFRDPGLTHKADISTESAAAVAGGVTSFMDMPNTKPQTTSVEALESKYKRAAEVSVANYSFFMGATNDNLDEVLAVDYRSTCGVKVFMGASTGNMLVDNAETLRQLFSKVKTLIAIHSEDEAVIAANKARLVAERGDDLPVQFHPVIRDAEACYQCTKRAVALARECGTRLNVLHLSTARELEFFDNNLPLSEKKITAEVCVHHLWFTDADYDRLGNRIKCNPAVKSLADREALRQALRDGKIDIVATDHAPHLHADKQGNCLTAASGMPLVQYSLVAMLEMAREGVFTVEMVVEKMCHAPAELYRVERRGYIRPGYYADLAIVAPVDAPQPITDEQVLSRCGWTPFVGATMHHRVAATYVNGHLAFDGKAVDSTTLCGKRLTFNN